MDVRQWFDQAAPAPRVSPTWVSRILKSRRRTDDPNAERRLVWLGGQPLAERRRTLTTLHIPGQIKEISVTLPSPHALWFQDLLEQSAPRNTRTASYPLFHDTRATFPDRNRDFTVFLRSPAWKRVRAAGLVLI
jgi:hypothetical protein